MNITEFKEQQDRRLEEAKEKGRKKEEDAHNNLNKMRTVPEIEECIRRGGDVQAFDWGESLKGIRNDDQRAKIQRAIIYNGYDFSDHAEVLVSRGVYREALTCLKHKELFKSEAAYERLHTQCLELVPYVRNRENLELSSAEHHRDAVKKNQEKMKKLKEASNKNLQESPKEPAKSKSNKLTDTFKRIVGEIAQFR